MKDPKNLEVLDLFTSNNQKLIASLIQRNYNIVLEHGQSLYLISTEHENHLEIKQKHLSDHHLYCSE